MQRTEGTKANTAEAGHPPLRLRSAVPHSRTAGRPPARGSHRACALYASRLQQDGGGPVASGRSVAAGNPAAALGELRAKAREQRTEAGAMLFPGSAVGYR
ncbi:hypothetical protein NN561_017369 [Cricetulus griseus]